MKKKNFALMYKDPGTKSTEETEEQGGEQEESGSEQSGDEGAGEGGE